MTAPADRFLALSAALTGFGEGRLRGTGLVGRHAATATAMAGEGAVADLLDAFEGAWAAPGEEERARRLHRDVLSDDQLGPLARAILKLWYVGTWHALPPAWHARWGGSAEDRDHVPSPDSYVEGLLWPAVGATPPGAKPAGYAMWARPPVFPEP